MLEFIKEHRLLVTALILLVVLGLLLTFRWRNPDEAHWVDETIQAVAYPFQASARAISTTVGGWVDDYFYLVDLKAENDRLRRELEVTQEELNQYINSANKYNLLREQLDFEAQDSSEKVYAEVIGESVDNFHHVLLINKGTLAGVQRNYPVVLRERVVGRVQSATATQAVVQMIIDRRHRFPVVIQRSRERLELAGNGGELGMVVRDRGLVFGLEDGLSLERIRLLGDLQVGDRVMTSGVAGIFPEGLLVGVVTEVIREPHELFQRAVVQPVVDFNKLEVVAVILRENTPQPPLFSDSQSTSP